MDLDEVVGRHHAALRVVAAHVDMAPTGAYATVSDPTKFLKVGSRYVPTLERARLHDELIAKALGGQSPELEHQAVVMAGPPGAGKGHVQGSQLGGLPGYLVIDADMFKEALVEHELHSGGLVGMTPPSMGSYAEAGERFAPFEYASLVHEESSILAKRLQSEQLAKGTNVVLDTVLKNEAAAERVRAQMAQHGYRFTVVSVQTTEAISRASIRGRWEGPYREFLAGQNELGGRPVPSGFARSVFPEGEALSGPERSAEWLRQNSDRCTEYRLYRREEGQPHRLEVHEKRDTRAAWRDAEAADVRRRQGVSFPGAGHRRAGSVDKGSDSSPER